MATKVFLREKKISKGRKSLYLDFYPPIINPTTGKLTRREFLGIYILEKPRTVLERTENKNSINLAETIRSKRFSQIQNGEHGSNTTLNREKSFTQFFKSKVDESYTSQGYYDMWSSTYKQFRKFYASDLKMGELSTQIVKKFKAYLKGLDLAQNTKHVYFSRFKAVIKEAFNDDMIPENYGAKVKGIKTEETKKEFLTWEELRKLANTECKMPVYKNAFIFSALTGLRHSDCKRLKWENIVKDENEGYSIRYKQKKTKGEETLHLSKLAYNLLGEPKEGNKAVFPDLNYTAWNNTKLQDWVSKAGINKKITFHCARHTFATIQLTLGTDIYTVSKLLGHKNLKNTQVYAKIIDKKKIDAMNKYDDLEF